MFAGCLLPSDVGATSLKEESSDRLHVLPLDVTNDHDISDAVEFVKNNCPKLGNNAFFTCVKGYYCSVN